MAVTQHELVVERDAKRVITSTPRARQKPCSKLDLQKMRGWNSMAAISNLEQVHGSKLPYPEGWYEARIMRIRLVEPCSSNRHWEINLEIVSGLYAAGTFWASILMTDNALCKIFRLLNLLGNESKPEIEPHECFAQILLVKVGEWEDPPGQFRYMIAQFAEAPPDCFPTD